MRIQIWRFMFGRDSSPEKVKELSEFFTSRMLSEFQSAYETKILVDLRSILDKKKNVISIFNIIDQKRLTSLDGISKNLRKFINNCVTHKTIDRVHTYRFSEIWDTVCELQRLFDESDKDLEIIWESEKLIEDDLTVFYEKVKRVNANELGNVHFPRRDPKPWKILER